MPDEVVALGPAVLLPSPGKLTFLFGVVSLETVTTCIFDM